MAYSHDEHLIEKIIQAIGDDPERPGLRETPKRVVRSWSELFSGYRMEKPVLTEFEESYDELIIVRRIFFCSTCEHHLLPFHGHASVCYIPNGRVVGLSKLARIVDWHARRLQVQERLTRQIAETLNDALTPIGVGVVIRATHLCMVARGVRQTASEAVTSAVFGALKDEGPARQEFLSLIRGGTSDG